LILRIIPEIILFSEDSRLRAIYSKELPEQEEVEEEVALLHNINELV